MSFEFKLPKTMPSWLEDVHTHGEVIHIHFADAYDDGVSDNTFAVASSKKELKQLKKSDADIVYLNERASSISTEMVMKKAGEKKTLVV